MNPIVQQVLADIAAAQSLDLLGQIYGWAAANITDPAALQAVAQACQDRDAQLRQTGVVPPLVMQAPPRSEGDIALAAQERASAADVAGVHAASVVPVKSTPPGWMATAADLAIGTRNATGNGGLPALDTLRVTMVDLAAAAWDCGIDVSEAPHLKAVSAATADQLWQTADYMLHAIRAQLAIQKNQKK